MTRRFSQRALLLTLALLAPISAFAADLGAGKLPLTYDPGQPAAFAAADEIRIAGTVEGDAAVIVVLRIDDGQSTSYATRYNEERTLPPGPFRWTLPATGLLTASGRLLDHGDIRRAFLFVGKGDARVVASRFDTAPAPRLPGPAKGYSLGDKTAPLAAGFERIAPDDKRIEAGNPAAVRRAAPDPLVASGIRGVERLRLPWPAGPARITLWTEDPGEWELLPHPLERRIRVNGRDVLSTRLTPQEWLETRYLRGITDEHSPTDDAWSAYGLQRGGRITADIDVGADGIVIELAGSGAPALYLGAVLLEPAGSAAALDFVDAQRAAWYRSVWPIVAMPDATPDATGIPQVRIGATNNASLKATAAPDTGLRLRLAALSTTAIATPTATIEPPALAGGQMQARIWASQQRLERRNANDTVLARGDNMLAGNVAALPLRPGEARTYEIWLDVPANAAPGLWTGAVLVGDPAVPTRVAVEIEVLPVRLPPVAKPAGYYLDDAPHATWFPGQDDVRDRQVVCDLALMRSFGLNGSAPALSTPAITPGRFEADMGRAQTAGVVAPWLGYTPAKRVLATHGVQIGARIIARVEQELRAKGEMPPVWSVADEPSNPGHPETQLREWVAALRAAAPAAKLAAQLNTPADMRLAALFDVLIVNDGFGLDLKTLRAASAKGRDLWLYNTAQPRLTAGLWLWRSPASRYIQWHARMPTADPLDPTDGREGDVQMIYPSVQTCPATPTIHRDLLDMAEGVVDQRWLLWLAAQPDTEARALAEKIRQRSGDLWAQQRTQADLPQMRESINQLARQRR
jgi:hypothetical protein